MSHDEKSYPHRRSGRDPQKRRDYLNHLIDRLLEIEAATDPSAQDDSAKDKDMKAFRASRIVAEIVDDLAGWAVDHQIGLAMNELKFVPRTTSRLRKRVDYQAAKIRVDDHCHEAIGGSDLRPLMDSVGQGAHGPATDRRILVNLLRANPGSFPGAVSGRAIEALEALEFGETKALLKPVKRGLHAQAYSRWRLQLAALAYVEYQKARGRMKFVAEKEVAEAYGYNSETVKGWKRALRLNLGNLYVASQLTYARNAGSNAEAAEKEGWVTDIRCYEDSYGPDALKRNARSYKALLRDEAR